MESQAMRTGWTPQQHKLLEQALAVYDRGTPDRWHNVGRRRQEILRAARPWHHPHRAGKLPCPNAGYEAGRFVTYHPLWAMHPRWAMHTCLSNLIASLLITLILEWMNSSWKSNSSVQAEALEMKHVRAACESKARMQLCKAVSWKKESTDLCSRVLPP